MYKCILAPIDVSAVEISETILARASFHLQNADTQLILISVAGKTADEAELDALTGQLMEFAESHISAHEGRIQLRVERGLPSDQVLAVAKEVTADCIFMGGHRGGTSQLGRSALGSTAAKVASQANCDVCIIKAG